MGTRAYHGAMPGPMFSSRHAAAWNETAGYGDPTSDPLEGGLSGNPGAARMLWAADRSSGTLDLLLLARATTRRQARHASRLYSVVPLYVTSYCMESCHYCSFRANNPEMKNARHRLSDSELLREAAYLMDEKGFRVIELVYAEDPETRVDAMVRQVSLVRRLLDQRGGGMVGLNAESLETGDYRRLAAAGVTFAVLWQETYDRDRYAELHPTRAKKSWFDYRLDTWERMLAGGIRHVGLGVLSGLADWRRDWAMLMQHEAHIARNCGVGAAILGLPRLKPAPGAPLTASAETPTDQELLRAVAVHTLFAPGTRPFVSTREPWELMVKLASGGGCLFTLNCSTTPGGYTGAPEHGQFPVHSYDAPVYGPRLLELGFRPEFQWRFPDAPAAQAVATAAVAPGR